MALIKAFKAIRPVQGKAAKIAALPYDVYSRAEAKAKVAGDSDSFLNIDRPETQYDDDFDMYSDEAYKTAHDLLWGKVEAGDLVKDEKENYYIYELTMDGRAQTGIVACASIDDYVNGVIKKHENTRADKEQDRIRHVDTCNAQTGPIFLAYRKNEAIAGVLAKVKASAPEADFVSDDGIGHRVWVISENADIETIRGAFDGINEIYIADGHHRAASAVKVGLKRREANPGYTGDEEFNFFLSVLFADEELMIMDYNRVVKELNGLDTQAFVSKVGEIFDMKKVDSADKKPAKKGEIGMYLEGQWYKLSVKACDATEDPVEGLDVSLLQKLLLTPVLGIGDPRTDKRIDFVGGIRGLEELERRCSATGDCKVAFAMYATSIQELFNVADAGLLMPPKSTWFEPKLRSGLFIHEI